MPYNFLSAPIKLQEETHMKQSTAKGFGAKGWIVRILTFFSILINAMIIDDRYVGKKD